MQLVDGINSYHAGSFAGLVKAATWGGWRTYTVQNFRFEFDNFFHPFVGELTAQLNETNVAGMLSPAFLSGPSCTYDYGPNDYIPTRSMNLLTRTIYTQLDSQKIDVDLPGGPYAAYNWELSYHIPVAIAVHLSNNQRFAEAQKWFHLVFDPTDPLGQYWRSFAFSTISTNQNLEQLLTILSTSDVQLNTQDPTGALLKIKGQVLAGYNAIMARPFDPFVVARTRPGSFQWYVVMKYLDNLIAWGDSLYMQDTIETINEALLCYVLAANLLGPRPQVMPQPGTTTTRNFLQLKQAGLDRMSNALVTLEAQFPFDTVQLPDSPAGNGTDQSGALFGIGKSLYFCVPQNQTLLGYWDIIADRLFKIRNSENLQGAFQQLPLFDPPLDPGMLVKAAAAGIDISSIVSGLNQPLGPLRALPLIQKSLELASEVKSMGASLLAALEKRDAEHLALLRQRNDVQLQTLTQNVRFLQWKHAEETTNGLIASRASAAERYAYYLRMLGLTPDTSAVPPTLGAQRQELTEDTWSDTYQTLVGVYEAAVATQSFGPLQLDQGSSPSAQSGASGNGQLYLNTSEAAELNTHLPTARDTALAASVLNTVASSFTPLPSIDVDLHYWGLGIHSQIFSGQMLAEGVRIAADVLQIEAAWHRDQAGIAGRTAGYQRRADDWKLQANLAARELMTMGKQILASLIAEQVARHDYEIAKTQIQQATAVQNFLQTKLTSEDFYDWMQSQLSGLYYQYYRFACDTARRAEQTMKRELMRAELDATQYIQFNYWDSGHQGLLSGEALYFSLKQLEMAYHDNNKRELELTRHVCLRQLDPVALLTLRITGSCTVTVPEWLFDRDTPGHYMRRIKSVALSIPSVVGPYGSVNATLTLQSSTVRTSSELTDGAYARNGQEDMRFVDYFGSTDVVVTSSGTNDSGMFETSLRDDRFLPFEGAGAVSVWNLSLPLTIRAIDYSTIADVILHIRYTARSAGDPLASRATTELKALLKTAGQAGQSLMFCLRYDFPTEWAAFVNAKGNAPFQVSLEKFHFPYVAQSASALTIDGLTLYAARGQQIGTVSPLSASDIDAITKGIDGASTQAIVSLKADPTVLKADPQQLVFMVLQYHFTVS
jgi:hypothetical protein